MVNKDIKGLIYDIQGFSVHDGPGIRTTVFLKGCPLHCPWCHSPESQGFKKEISFMDMKCIGTAKCGLCLKSCPEDAISLGIKEWSNINEEEIQHINVDFDKCGKCNGYPCTDSCFSGALAISGKEYTVGEVVDRVKKDMDFYRHSDEGGATVSGGEAMSQFDFTLNTLMALTEEGIDTALDTTGFAPTDKMLATLPYVNHYLYDLKHMDSAKHKEVIGVPNELILKNASELAKNGAHFQIRIPVIPGFNDSDGNFEALGDFIVSLGSAVDTVQLLPYHRFGDVKYERLNRKSPMPPEILPPSEESMKARAKQFEALGLHAVIH